MISKLIFIALACAGFAAEKAPAGSVPTVVHAPYTDTTSIEVYKQTNRCVRLLPLAARQGAITISSETSTPVHFYVFDAEGTMLHQALIGGNEQKTISLLKKGAYMYDVFRNNEGVERGKIIVQ